MSGGVMHKAIWKASFEAKYSFWIKGRTAENMRKFSAEQSYPKF